jgi:gluconolactonase
MKPTVLLISIFLVFSLAFVSIAEDTAQNNPESIYSIIYRDTEPELVVDGTGDSPGLTFTEGPSWMNGTLYFSNILWKGSNGRVGLHALLPDGSCVSLNDEVKTEGSTPLPNGNLAVCDLGSRRIIEMSPAGEVVRVLADSCEGIPLGPPNDVTTDTKGGIYFTEPFSTELTGNAVFYITPQGEVKRVTGWNEFSNPNGCVLSADGSTFYLGDYLDYTIWEFDINPDGTLTGKSPFATVRGREPDPATGRPLKSCADGMAIDRDGNLYVATRIGIQVFSPNGGFIGIITLPKQPAHCVFGGDDLSDLYTFCRDQVYAVRTKMRGWQYPIVGGE